MPKQDRDRRDAEVTAPYSRTPDPRGDSTRNTAKHPHTSAPGHLGHPTPRAVPTLLPTPTLWATGVMRRLAITL